MTDMNESTQSIGHMAYSGFADRYAAAVTTKPHNALYERPATMSLLGDVDGLRVLDAALGPVPALRDSLPRSSATNHREQRGD